MTEPNQDISLNWQKLPALPQSIAGQFVGVSGDKLVVSGGTHWTSAPWNGGEKLWSDKIYVLQEGDAVWREAGKQTMPLSYGASVSARDSMICIGGQTAEAASAKVFQIRIAGDKIETTNLPDLPQPVTMTCAALVGDTIYVAGGQSSPDAREAMNNFWSLKLSDKTEKQEGWLELEPCPGAERILPVAAGNDDTFFLFSGTKLRSPESGMPATRRYLNDAYCFRPGEGWRRLKNLPRPIVAGLALNIDASTIVILGGDDGANVARSSELKDAHPGFSRLCYSYRHETDEWTSIGEMPISLVTTGIAFWNDKIVVAGGEDRPGSRSAQVIAASIRSISEFGNA